MAKLSEDKVVHCSCQASGCGNVAGGCTTKVYVKNGAIVRLEPGDPLNPGKMRDDLSEEAMHSQMFQHRLCSRAYTWRETVHHPDRAMYPMKRVGERGERKFARISWAEALDTVANRTKEIARNYGPYCILGDFPVLPWVGPWGFQTWGLSSNSGFILPDLVTLGYCHSQTAVTDKEVHEHSDIFNTRLIIWFGANPAVTLQGSANWVMAAREKGIPIIIVDPNYSVSSEVYADQWIPIRPNTDVPMLLAMANVMFKEGLYDREYVGKFVEPIGFKKWQDYVLGQTAGPDGKIDRTPEWAENICGVPAQTTRELARLYARTKPAYFRVHRSVTRQLYGEEAGRASIYLQAMTGNLGVSGGHAGGNVEYGRVSCIREPSINWGNTKPAFPPRRLMWKRAWMDSVLLREKMQKGEMTEDEYRRTCGIAKDWPLANIQMVWLAGANDASSYKNIMNRSGRPSLGNLDLNKFITALKKVKFVVSAAYFQSAFQNHCADVILPLADPFFEEARGFVAAGSASNDFICGFKAVEPPGEARPLEWIMVQLAKRLGVAEQYSPRVLDVVDDYPNGWNRRIEELLKEAYETWAKREDIAPRNPPAWDEFRKSPIYRVPFTGPPKVAFGDQIKKGKPFDTPSGKIEFYSDFLADAEMARKSYFLPQRKIDNEVCFGGSVPPTIPPMAEWVLPWNSMLAARAQKFPLALLTSHSFHRQHTSQDNNPLMRDETRHGIHLNATDAKPRNIKDGDLAHVFNDKGEVILPAHVTSRITPGTVLIRHGAWPELSKEKTDLMPEGIDRRGADNFLTTSQYYPWVVGAIRCTELVQVEKYRGSK